MGSIDRLKGTVKWFDRKRGFGFITPETCGEDVFVHKSSIKGVGSRSLTEGETVEFVISVGYDGRSSAVDVSGPGGVFVQGRGYFSGACYRCNKIGHMARDCVIDARLCGPGPCYSCGEMGHLARDCHFTLFASPSKPSGWGPLPYISPLVLDLLANNGTPFDLLSVCTDSDEVEQSEESNEDEFQREGEVRNWADLPGDVLLVIFKKIAAAEILRSVQFVCKPWKQLSYVPTLWRCIDFRIYDFFDDMESVAIMAVDRSMGCLEELYVEYFPTDKLLSYITERATLLRRLHLISVCLYDATLVKTVKSFPLLEELEITHCSFSDEVVEQVAEACPNLKSFRLNARVYKLAFTEPVSFLDRNVDAEAFAIAKHMNQLRRLQLYGNSLSSAGLSAILDGCPHLEHLDLRQCLNVDLDESLKKKCAAGIKIMRFPNDSTADYEYRASFDELTAYDADFDPTLSDTYYDFGYDYSFSYDYFGGSLSDLGYDSFDDFEL